ncbi:MAG TPA: alpha/beta fold hydrolase [Streptosporangiales bacterium]
MARRNERTGRTATVAIAAAGVLAAIVAGVAAILGAAAVTARPALFLGAGLVAFAVVDGLVAYAVGGRTRRAARRRVRWAFFASTSVVLVAAFAVTALRPDAEAATVPRLPGETVVTVPTGSRLAVVHLPARGRVHRPPVVVVHGGPGVPDLPANATAFAPLAAHGSDVYLYAQLGTGRSGRLADPRGYTADRGVADLEALRRHLGLARMVLVGHSYGAALAADYLAGHPGRVAALALISPGAVDPSDTSSSGVLGRLPVRRRLHAYAAVLPPRPMLGWALLQVNPRAAHAFYPDREADARNDEVVSRASPALHCDSASRPQTPSRGTGFYAMQYPQSAAAPRPPDLRHALTGLRTPTLIVKGSCDYLSWHSAVEYRRLLPRSRLVYLHGVGHNLHQDRPALVCAMISALLDGRRLPVAAYTRDAAPKDYQGPA